MYKLLFTLSLFAVLSAFTCKGKHGSSALENKDWQLRTIIEDKVAHRPPADVMITAMFKDGALSGNGGCNSYNSTYTIIGDQLSLGMTAATKMFCPANEWETRYFRALEGTQSWKISDGKLTIRTTNGALLFEKP